MIKLFKRKKEAVKYQFRKPDDFIAVLSEKDTEIRGLRNELAKQLETIEHAKLEIDELNSRITNITEEKNILQTTKLIEIRGKESTIQTKEKENEELKERFLKLYNFADEQQKNLLEQNKKILDEQNFYKEQLYRMDRKFKDLEKNMEQLIQEKNSMERTIKQLDEELAHAKKEKIELTRDFSYKLIQKEELLKTIKEEKGKTSEPILKELQKKQEQCDNFESEIRAAATDKINLEKRINDFKKQIREVSRKNEDLSNEIRITKVQMINNEETYKLMLIEKEKEIEKLTKDITSTSDELQKIVLKDLADLNKKIKEVHKEKEGIFSEKQELTKENQLLSLSIKLKEDALVSIENKLIDETEKLKVINDKMKEIIFKLRKHIVKLREKRDIFLIPQEKLICDIREKFNRYDEGMKSDLTSLKQEFKEITQEIKNEHDSLKNDFKQNSYLDITFKRISGQIQNLESLLASGTSEITALDEAYKSCRRAMNNFLERFKSEIHSKIKESAIDRLLKDMITVFEEVKENRTTREKLVSNIISELERLKKEKRITS